MNLEERVPIESAMFICGFFKFTKETVGIPYSELAQRSKANGKCSILNDQWRAGTLVHWPTSTLISLGIEH